MTHATLSEMRAWIWGALVAGCVGCGGSSDDGTGTNGSGASAGTGGSAGSGTGGTGGTGTGGSAGSGTGGTGGTGTGGTGGAAQCSENSACVIRPSTCCGQCGVATRGDVIALPSTEVQAYSDSVCSSGGGCPPCAGDADPTLVATCRAGACEVVDLLTDPATGCSSDTDCMLRASACCECGADVSRSGLVAIAVSQFATYSGYVCDSSGVCDGCVPTYPSEAHASCLIGHCTVVWTN